MPKRIAVCVFTMAVTAAAAWVGPAAAAEPKPGFYVGMSAGANIPADTEGTVTGTKVTLEYDPGYTLGLAAGYRFGRNWRAEADFSYARHNPASFRFPGATARINADVDVYSATVGLYYDLRLGEFAPYIGGGGGVAHQSSGTITATVAGVTATAPGADSTDPTAFGEVGIGWALSDRFELVPSYRFQWIGDGGSGIDDTMVHLLRLGFRLGF